MSQLFVGRDEEQQILVKIINSRNPELGIVYGRRRVGKSSLLKSINIKNKYYFEAVKNYSSRKQVQHFLKQFSEQAKLPPLSGETWEQAFDIVTPYFAKKQVFVIFDELSWMANDKTELVALIKYYWDNKWKLNSQFKLILCGSIAQFMIHHVVHSEALHNRKTFEIRLSALSAQEAGRFFGSRISNYEKMLFLMTIGGVPKYLEQIDTKKSFITNLREHFFSPHGFFVNEFETIFKEQFKKFKTYELIINSLQDSPKSLIQMGKELNMEGGGFSLYLENLINADFVKKNIAFNYFGNKKDKTIKYQINDEFIRFYKCFIEKNSSLIRAGLGTSLPESLENKLHSYFGTSFELFCIKNIKKIIQYLKIKESEIINFGPYFSQANRLKKVSNAEKPEKGFQIDIAIVLKKKRIVICECKFSQEPVGKNVIKEMEDKLSAVKIPSSISKSLVLISASGATKDLLETEFFDEIIPLETFFV
jgi:AAA+ ATPase superfamily predicted ATPase